MQLQMVSNSTSFKGEPTSAPHAEPVVPHALLRDAPVLSVKYLFELLSTSIVANF